MIDRTPFQESFEPTPRNITREVLTVVALGLLTAIIVVGLIWMQAFQRLEVLT